MGKSDEFGDRMKGYEMAEAGRRMPDDKPFVVRLDGKGFSKFTRGLKRPYDERLSELMIDTARYLLTQSGALLGYTQSDEITLVFMDEGERGSRYTYFNGRVQKLTSVLAGMASAYFARHIDARIPEKAGAIAVFDCRAWHVPNAMEAANAVLWRILDAERNSVAMAAQAMFAPKALQGVSKAGMKSLLEQAGQAWDSSHPPLFKWGTLIQRVKVKRQFTQDEIAQLPLRHNARLDPTAHFERTVLQPLPFLKRPTIADILPLVEQERQFA